MAKLSFMKWYPTAWINDTRELSPEAKAAWIDILCLMWNAPQRGVWKGTYQEFARATGLPWEMAPSVITELSHKTSRVTIRDNEVTLENRRMIKHENDYKYHAIRQRKYRMRQQSDKKVTRKTLDVTQDVNNTTPKDIVRQGVPQIDDVAGYQKRRGWFEKLWPLYPAQGRLRKKTALQRFLASVPDLETAKRCARALDKYLESKRVKDGFIQNAPTWFGDWESWESYQEESLAPLNR